MNDKTPPEQQLAQLLKKQHARGIGEIFKGQGARATAAPAVTQGGDSSSAAAPPSGTGFDRKEVEILLDRMVANALSSGRETSGVLRSLFGIVPELLGR